MDKALDIQRALIMSYLSIGNERLKARKIHQNYFTNPLHILIVKSVLWQLEKDIEVNEDTVLYFITKNNNIDMQEWLNIQCKNPFATDGTIKTYEAVLRDIQKEKIYDL